MRQQSSVLIRTVRTKTDMALITSFLHDALYDGMALDTFSNSLVSIFYSDTTLSRYINQSKIYHSEPLWRLTS